MEKMKAQKTKQNKKDNNIDKLQILSTGKYFELSPAFNVILFKKKFLRFCLEKSFLFFIFLLDSASNFSLKRQKKKKKKKKSKTTQIVGFKSAQA